MLTRHYTDVAPALTVPSSYMEIISKTIKAMDDMHYSDITTKYATIKTETTKGHRDVPIFRFAIEDEIAVENTALWQQSLDFWKMSSQVIPDVAATTYYYCASTMLGFFVKSIIEFEGETHRHGLRMTGWSKLVRDCKIKLEGHGHFARIVDCYAILRTLTHFSAFQFNENTEKCEAIESNQWNYLSRPEFSVDQLIEKIREAHENNWHHELDLLYYLLLFVASNMARYKPALWRSCVLGKKEDTYYYFQKAYEWVDIMRRRVVCVLISLSEHARADFPLQSHPIRYKNPDLIEIIPQRKAYGPE